MHKMITPIHHKIYTLRKNDKKFKEIFKILDTLVFEAQKTDKKVMGFLKP